MAFLFVIVCLFFFSDEIAFYSIQRNELKRFPSGTILSFAKKLSASFQLVKPINTLELHYQIIQFSNEIYYQHDKIFPRLNLGHD